MKKATRSEEQSSQSHGQITTSNNAKAPSKIANVLAHLLNVAYIHTSLQDQKRTALNVWHAWLDEQGFIALQTLTRPSLPTMANPL